MPRVNRVKRAQQRYETKPVIDPATGEQKRTPVMNTRTGEPKLTKSGRPVVLRVTERDLERPLPMPSCDYLQCAHISREIAPGDAYQWIQPSGGRMRSRHADCPTWQVWEYSSSLSARIAEIQYGGPDLFDSVEDARSWAESKAEEIRDLAEEKRESASNIEEGFGHPTSQSEELEDIAEQLSDWAGELENTDLPEPPECSDCEGEGCDTCVDDHDDWREDMRSVLEEALENSPV